MKEDKFLLLALEFLHRLEEDLFKNTITIKDHWDIDHLCYRVGEESRYEFLKESFLSFGDLLIESEVNGRLISTFKLHHPIFFKTWRIDLLELPAPKKGKTTPEGFEHIEIVIDTPFKTIMDIYPHLDLETKGLAKDYNQELEICLGERNIKFHHSSLYSVINLEKNEAVYKALMKSQVLSIFKDHHPLVAGTFPLGVYNSESDLDILLTSTDLQALAQTLQTHYGHYSNFKIDQLDVDGLPTLISHFTFENVPFEIFAQDRHPVEQVGYRHFQIEERLLKLGGKSFFEKVKALRLKGLKTEPAFAEALGLSGDPYKELLNPALYRLKDI